MIGSGQRGNQAIGDRVKYTQPKLLYPEKDLDYV
jgi:hypothetical protein